MTILQFIDKHAFGLAFFILLALFISGAWIHDCIVAWRSK